MSLFQRFGPRIFVNYHNYRLPVTPIIWARVPSHVMQDLRLKGFHDGYWRNQNEVDATLAGIFESKRYGAEKLGEWATLIELEALLKRNGFATIYSPKGDPEIIRKHFGPRLIEAESETIDGFIEQLERSPLWRWNLAVFYHVACMGNWRDVIEEQFSLLASVGLLQVHVTVLGSSDDLKEVVACAKKRGVEIILIFHNENIQLYEFPTIQILEQYAYDNDGAILYLHTKGVSNPNDEIKRLWREVMQEFVVRRWRENVLDLATYDLVGVNWMQTGDPHFSGNFWITHCEYIRKQKRFGDYFRESHGYPWGQVRVAAEFWVGAGNFGEKVKSLFCTGQDLQDGPILRKYHATNMRR